MRSLLGAAGFEVPRFGSRSAPPGNPTEPITAWHHAALESVDNPEALNRMQGYQDQIEAPLCLALAV